MDVPTMFTDRLLSNYSTYMVRLDRTVFGFRKRYGKIPVILVVMYCCNTRLFRRRVRRTKSTVYAFLRWFCTEIEGENERVCRPTGFGGKRDRRRRNRMIRKFRCRMCSVRLERPTFYTFVSVVLFGFSPSPLKCEIKTPGSSRRTRSNYWRRFFLLLLIALCPRDTQNGGTRPGVAKSEKRTGNGEEERREKRREDITRTIIAVIIMISARYGSKTFTTTRKRGNVFAYFSFFALARVASIVSGLTSTRRAVSRRTIVFFFLPRFHSINCRLGQVKVTYG